MYRIYFKMAASGAEAYKIAQAMEEACCQVFTVQVVPSEVHTGVETDRKYLWHIWGRYDVGSVTRAGIDAYIRQELAKG